MKLLEVVRGRGELLFGVILGLVGIAVVVIGSGYGIWTDRDRIGPGASPALWGSILTLSAAFIVINSLRRRPDEPPPPADAASAEEPEELAAVVEHDAAAGNGRKAALLFALLVVTLVLSTWTGLIVAAVLFVFVVSKFVERQRLLTSALLAVGTGAAMWGIFVLLLGLKV